VEILFWRRTFSKKSKDSFSVPTCPRFERNGSADRRRERVARPAFHSAIHYFRLNGRVMSCFGLARERLNVGVVVRRFLHTCTWSLEVWNQNGSNKEGSGTHCPDAMGSGTLGSLGQPLSARPRLCALRRARRFVVVLHLIVCFRYYYRSRILRVSFLFNAIVSLR